MTPKPKWLADIASLLPVTSQFVLSGNIADRFLVESRFEDIEMMLWRELRDAGTTRLLRWRPWSGLEVTRTRVAGDESFGRDLRKSLGSRFGAVLETGGSEETLEGELLGLLRLYAGADARLAETALLISCTENPAAILSSTSFVAGAAIEQVRERSSAAPILWLSPNINDVPHWLLSGHDHIRQVVIPLPDRSDREDAAGHLYDALPHESRPQGEAGRSPFATALAGGTHGQTIQAMSGIVTLAGRKHIAAVQIKTAIDWYRLGDMAQRNPWELPELRAAIAESENTIGQRVKGQADAVATVSDILMRIYTGLSGAHVRSSSRRPRGVLFFAGPTGVGKTETAKAIASIVFGDEEHCLRFDMSEFSAEHSAARLIGAPPGYVGFNEGGELVNAIRENPFRVILFDEIEKAHQGILDKFLQILEDGRLTDGRGQTVYFSDCLIIFTSNLGIFDVPKPGENTRERKVHYSTETTRVRTMIETGVKKHFTEVIGRPELLNRIGRNIVVFDFISAEAGTAIVAGMLDNVCQRVARDGIMLVMTTTFKDRFCALCLTDDVLDDGGRGIGSKIEQMLVNPLSRVIFRDDVSTGDTVTLDGIDVVGGRPALRSTVKRA